MPLLFFLLLILFLPQSSIAATPTIVITEIAASLPSAQEWLEIYNPGVTSVNLTDWRFVEGVTASKPEGERHKIIAFQGDFSIEAGEYAIIANNAVEFKKSHSDFEGTIFDSSWSSLSEDGELIKLLDTAGSTVEEFTYPAGKVGILERINPLLADYTGANWIEVNGQGTPGRANGLELAGEEGVEKIMEVIPSDIELNEKESEIPNSKLQVPNKFQIFNDQISKNIEVDGSLQAEAGEDVAAFVGQEIIFDGSFSTSPTGASITYFWDFDDDAEAEGQIVKHIYSKEGDYFARLEVRNARESDVDKVRVAVVEAEEAEQNQTAVLTSSDTPTSEQTIAAEKSDLLSLADLKTLPTDTKVTVAGVVTVEPGIFSKMYFYLSSADGFAGAQVYASASEFPVLHIGQWVEVQGLTSRYYGVSRVRIRSKNDITIVRGQDPPTPVPVNSAKITDDYLGRLLVLKGNILKEEGKILLEDSSGSQLRLEIKEATGIKKEDLAEGDTCQIAGILDKTSGGFRLLPRYPGDIVKIASISDIASAQIADTQENGKVLGESVSSTGAFDQLNLSSASPVMQLPAEESNRPQVIKYLLVTLAAGVIVLAGLKIKTWRKSNYP